MKILDRYIIQKFIVTFFFAIFLLIAIAIVIDITEKIDDFISNQAPLYEVIVHYYFNFIPWIGLMLAPLFVFVSVVYFTSRLTTNTEIICMLNGGVSFYRLLVPYIFTSILFALLFAYYNHYILPKNNKTRIHFEEQYASKKDKKKTSINYHFQIGRDTFIYTQSFDMYSNTGYRFSIEKIKDFKQLYKLSADNILWDSTKHQWKLLNWKYRQNVGNIDNVQKGKDTFMTLPIGVKEYETQTYDIEAMTTKELKKYIVDQIHKGNENVSTYKIEAYRRSAVPFSTIILTLIAVAMTTKKVRNGMGIYVVIALLLSSSYIVIQQFSTVFATKGNLDPLLAVWIPNIIYGFIAIFLLLRAPK